LGLGFDRIGNPDINNPNPWMSAIADRYASESVTTEEDKPNLKHKEPWRMGVGMGMDIGGTATEALDQAATKSVLTQRVLIEETGQQIRKKLALAADSDLSSKLSYDSQSGTFKSKDGAIDDIVSDLNDNLKGLDKSRDAANSSIDSIMSLNKVNGKVGHDLEKLVRVNEYGWGHTTDESLSSFAKNLGPQYENVIEGAEKVANFKATKLIPFWDAQVQIAQQASPSADPITHAVQEKTLAYAKAQAEAERLAAAKLYRDAALLNMGYAQMKVDSKNDNAGASLAIDGPNGASYNLDQAATIEQQLLQRGWKPENLSADQRALADMMRSIKKVLGTAQGSVPRLQN